MNFAILATVFIGTIGNWLDYGKPCASDYIAAREGYVVGYNSTTRCPDWVAERLTLAKLSGPKTRRSDDFRPDMQIPTTAQLEDYRRSGWSRGHMVPAADCKWSASAMSQTFLLTNMCPQDQRNNAGAWNRVEEKVRSFARGEGSLYVITGPVYDPSKPVRTIGPSRVRVPDGFFKVVLDETPPRKMIAFLAPNEDTKRRPAQLAVSVDTVERATGFDFFSDLPKSEQEKLESEVNLADWTSAAR